MIRFAAAEEGPTAVEYAALLLLVMLACLTAITAVGRSTATSFQDSSSRIESVEQGHP